MNFPVHNLDLSEYVKHNAAAASQSHIYELYAVDNHYGGLGSGHYSAYAKVFYQSITCISHSAWSSLFFKHEIFPRCNYLSIKPTHLLPLSLFSFSSQ